MSCHGTEIIGGNDSYIKVGCGAPDSCTDAIIMASDSHILLVSCRAEGACSNLNITCPQNGDVFYDESGTSYSKEQHPCLVSGEYGLTPGIYISVHVLLKYSFLHYHSKQIPCPLVHVLFLLIKLINSAKPE